MPPYTLQMGPGDMANRIWPMRVAEPSCGSALVEAIDPCVLGKGCLDDPRFTSDLGDFSSSSFPDCDGSRKLNRDVQVHSAPMV